MGTMDTTKNAINPTTMPRHIWWRVQMSIVKHRVRSWVFGNEEGRPPNDWVSTGYFKELGTWHDGIRELSAIFRADGNEIEISERYTDEQPVKARQAFSCTASAFRRLAIWYLWRWAWGEWFGSRRRLYYWDLHRRVERMRKARGQWEGPPN